MIHGRGENIKWLEFILISHNIKTSCRILYRFPLYCQDGSKLWTYRTPRAAEHSNPVNYKVEPPCFSRTSVRHSIGLRSGESGDQVRTFVVFLEPFLNDFCRAAGSFILPSEAVGEYGCHEGAQVVCSSVQVDTRNQSFQAERCPERHPALRRLLPIVHPAAVSSPGKNDAHTHGCPHDVKEHQTRSPSSFASWSSSDIDVPTVGGFCRGLWALRASFWLLFYWGFHQFVL